MTRLKREEVEREGKRERRREKERGERGEEMMTAADEVDDF